MTWLAAWYLQVRWIHVGCVILSGSLFFVRGCLMLSGSRLANHLALRRLSYLIDTTLLAAAVLLTMIIHQYPFVQAWLTAKVLLLVAYIALGILALRRGRTRRSRAAFFVAALAVFLFIVSVAVAHSPLGVFMFL